MAGVARAEVKTVVERNRDGAAVAEFKFEGIAAPSRTDAANQAKIAIVAGRQDRNGGDLSRLNDGWLPQSEDDPQRNFFFAAGSEGGRIVLDLGEAIEIQQINTYSWHTNTRGPQVYKLYSGDPASAEFDAAPRSDADLAKTGWKLLAEVDTRPEARPGGRPGGQYAVSVRDSDGGTLGAFRYLLFDVTRTESDDPFGNTFFSEIDVLDGREHPPRERLVEAAVELDVLKIGEEYEIAFDMSQLPEIKPWVEAKLKPVCTEWYPKIVALLPSEGYTAPRRFTIVFHKDMSGVANAGGGRINCAGPWFLRNLNGEAAGAVVHEMVHIVQRYGRTRRENRNPGWMVEGVADYIRWFLYEPEDKRPRPNPARANYDDSYRTTAAFLDFVMRRYDKDLVRKLNADMREGNYRDDTWEKYTGKPPAELWGEYVETLKTPAGE
jgi:uncharacterized protein (DUF2249 family)